MATITPIMPVEKESAAETFLEQPITEKNPVAQTYLDDPPAYDFKDLTTTDRKELIIADSRSINSSTSDTSSAPASSAVNFNPTRTLLVNARGKRLIGLPLAPRQLQIPITDTIGNIVYTSKRAKRSSGNAILSNAAGVELLASEYFFGPGREPKITLLTNENAYDGAEEDALVIKTKGKWTNRSQDFHLPVGAIFTWKYVREHDHFASTAAGKDKRRTHLVLEVEDSIAEKVAATKKVSHRRVAELVRNEEARTLGTTSSDAGNGGELRIDTAACEAAGISEEVVVSSCLMMLKKEIDRRRAVQFMIIAAAAS